MLGVHGIVGIEPLFSTRLHEWEREMFEVWAALKYAETSHLKALKAEDFDGAEDWRIAIRTQQRRESDLWQTFQEIKADLRAHEKGAA